MILKNLAALLSASLILLATAAIAGPPDSAPAPGPGQGPAGMKQPGQRPEVQPGPAMQGQDPEERAVEFFKSIGVDEDKARAIAKEMQKLAEQKRTLLEEEMALIERLEKLLQGEKPDKGEMKALIRELDKKRAQRFGTFEAEASILHKYLSDEQYARLLLQGRMRRQAGPGDPGMRQGGPGGPGMRQGGPGMRQPPTEGR